LLLELAEKRVICYNFRILLKFVGKTFINTYLSFILVLFLLKMTTENYDTGNDRGSSREYSLMEERDKSGIYREVDELRSSASWKNYIKSYLGKIKPRG